MAVFESLCLAIRQWGNPIGSRCLAHELVAEPAGGPEFCGRKSVAKIHEMSAPGRVLQNNYIYILYKYKARIMDIEDLDRS